MTTAPNEPPESDRDHFRRRLHLLHHANALTDPEFRAAIDAEPEAADRLHRQLVAARAEADGLAEAMRNADRLYAQHLTEERGKLREAAAWIIRIGYPHDWTGDEHPPPAVWDALVDAVHDDPTGRLHGNSLSREEVEAGMRVETGRPEDGQQGMAS